MNDNSKTGYEQIGDKQYHHFTLDIPDSISAVTVTLGGNDSCDVNLYLARNTLAFKGNALYADTGKGTHKSITFNTNGAGGEVRISKVNKNRSI